MKSDRLSDDDLVRVCQAVFSLRNVYESKMRAEQAGESDEPTIAEMGVLMVLGQASPMNSRALARRMDLTPGTVSQYVARLAKRGLLEMRRDEEDRRNWSLVLTQAGIRAYKSAYRGTVKYTEDMLAPLSPGERRLFHDLLAMTARANGYDWL